MFESKIGLTDRLRRKGRWAEASKFKDETVKKLRAEGMKRAEARDRGWEETAEAYQKSRPAAELNLTASGDSELEAEERRICGQVESEVDRWAQRHGITLPDDARHELVGGTVAFYCAMGLLDELRALSSERLILS